MLCIDSTFLGLLIHQDAVAGRPVDRLKERLELVRKNWDADHEKIIIPTPVLSEFLVLAGKDGPLYLEKIHKTSNFQIMPFDEMAAIELAAIQVEITSKQSKGEQKRSAAEGTHAKIKFDRQIVAIAKVHHATVIYSDDEKLKTFAKAQGIEVIQTWELPLPQPTLLDDLPDPGTEEKPDEPKTTDTSTTEIRGSTGSPAKDEAGTTPGETEVITVEENETEKPKATSEDG